MNFNFDNFYQGLLAKDKRFDGVFFVGVTSTNIYCRPICTARTPKKANCTFFKSAAEAEVSGFRPCLKCRPELAPGLAPMEASKRLAKQAFIAIQENGIEGNDSTEEIAQSLGISTRHLRRILQTEYGVSPNELAKTHKLLTAKRLLTDTNLSLIQVAFASGFNSVRSFNHQFKKHYSFPPSQLRQNRKVENVDNIRIRLAYRAPIAWQQLLDFLKLRAIGSVELVKENAYIRTVELAGNIGWIKIYKKNEHLVLETNSEMLPCLTSLIARVNNLFDLEANPQQIYEQLESDPILKPALKSMPGIRVPGCFEEFELCFRAIAGQLVSVKSASTITTRFVEAFGTPVITPFDELNRISPKPETIALLSEDQICQHGFTKSKASAIINLAKLICSKNLKFNSSNSSDSLESTILSINGIGPWTANYIGMRALRNPDAFPANDLVLKQVLGLDNYKEVESVSKKWQPWRAYAAMCLWSMKNVHKSIS